MKKKMLSWNTLQFERALEIFLNSLKTEENKKAKNLKKLIEELKKKKRESKSMQTWILVG